ncbi:GFA family protein [Kiloniella majae]|uniref:GFA family protein n=1 Tax=Kiloniella majae TaxID=1938558 RepID=UPI000A27726F|nr:GFA family protein [Kiloniella majae]
MEKHYSGGCQCGAVLFEVDVNLDQSITCNCSRCQPLGVVLAFAPRDKFILHNGAENLTEYRFNKREIAHLFCKICGIQSFSYGQMPDGTKIAAINVNTLKDVKPSELSPTHFDGRSI